MKPYFEGNYEVFAFRDVIFMQKYTEEVLKNISLRKVRNLEVFHSERGEEMSGILVVFKDSFPCEYPHEDQFERVVFVSNQDGEADRLLIEWKAYIEAKEGIAPSIHATSEFMGKLTWQNEWIDE